MIARVDPNAPAERSVIGYASVGHLQYEPPLARCLFAMVYYGQLQEDPMAPVIEVTRETLRERRSVVLARLDMSEAEFREAIVTRRLSSEDWEAKEELDEIQFLLGADDTVA